VSFRERLARDPWLVVALVLGIVLFGLVLLPQLWLVRASFLEPDGATFTLQGFVRYLTARRYRSALLNSLAIGLITTALSVIVAVPLAFLHARYRLPGRDTVLTLATLSTASPPFLGAYAWILLLGWNGWLSRGLREMSSRRFADLADGRPGRPGNTCPPLAGGGSIRQTNLSIGVHGAPASAPSH